MRSNFRPLLVLTLLLAVAGVAAAPASAGAACDVGLPDAASTCKTGLRGAWEELFPSIGRIQYEGPDSDTPLAFHYYNAEEVVHGKPMREWLRFSMAYWHTIRADGSDPFGAATKRWPWEQHPAGDDVELAFRRMRAFFELLDKLGVDFWCFHDRDIAPELPTLADTNAALDQVVALAKELQAASGKRVLWGTAQLFKHPRYMHGAATSPNATVFAHAAAQVKKAMEATKELGGENFVFWGGREGYQTLLNTDLALEQHNLARFLRMAADYKRKLGLPGPLLLEPKPQEPAKHQYDFDVSTTAAFLLRHGLDKDFKLNIECNHATLAGHSCYHELETAAMLGLLGSIDANSGDPQTGWDTDQFPTDIRETTLMMLTVLRQGGLAPGGLNFDAKLRRESTAIEDLVLAHISGMDAMARGLRNAARLLEDGVLERMRAQRYSSWRDTQLGRDITAGKVGLEDLERVALAQPEPFDSLPSGQQELYEIQLSRYVR
ncbi:hypothetical protein ABPG75_005640 [Micractinium tetrahymenae]